MGPEGLPDWERLLAAERHLQSLVPGAVLVGGTAAARHAGHRKSFDKKFDALYPQSSGTSPLAEVAQRLATAAPSDAPEVDLRTYKGLVAPWNDWGHLATRGRHWAQVLATGQLSGETP